MELESLVRRAGKGDDSAFEQLLEGVRDPLYRTAYTYVRNEQDALDVYQESVYKAYSTLHKLEKPGRFASWITSIVIFTAIDFIRKEARQFPTDDEAVFSMLIEDNAGERIAHSLDVKRALSILDPVQKTVLILRYYHEFSIKEIAAMMDCPAGTVKSHLFRAKKRLRPVLKEGYL